MKDGTYIVRLDDDGIPMLTNQINMTDGYWVSDDSGVSVHGGLNSDGIVDALRLMDIESGEIVGVWQDNGISYIDRSYHIRQRDTALKMAKAFEQKAVWDCLESKPIRV
jgi:hypothetical protein